MYQQSINHFTENGLTKLTKIFEETVTKFELDKNSIKLDLNKEFIPIWACAWNKIENIQRPCIILQKNDKIAIVQFVGNTLKETLKNMLQHIYRIEDLAYSK